ncbi:MAG: tRNA guanosine(34) transglycosylase Tgt [Bacteroidota bacterium]|jgi:queuine tRNA-ribosyltransferase
MQFEQIARDPGSSARAGVLTTDHGAIETPIFMPVGTQGTVKAVPQTDLAHDIRAQIILGNTYHLYLRPGTEILEEAGGLHRFMHWDRPILTDSGGFQVYSLAHNRKIREEGVTFRSHIDGSSHLFSPEVSMDIQRSIGADIIMAFDECPPYPSTYAYARESMEMTHRWLDRCIARLAETEPLYGHRQHLFPIVQGSTFKDLRLQSAAEVASRPAAGYAIGGLSVGEPAEDMYEAVHWVTGVLPQDRPRYLMGVGTPANILECIALGVDMFDCVMPTRNARNGTLFTWKGIVNMKNARWERDFGPLDPDGTSPVDSYYSRAYVRHLFKAEELLALSICSIHNLAFYLELVRVAREHILAGDFAAWKAQVVPQLMGRA